MINDRAFSTHYRRRDESRKIDLFMVASASSERAFSKAGRVITSERYNLALNWQANVFSSRAIITAWLHLLKNLSYLRGISVMEPASHHLQDDQVLNHFLSQQQVREDINEKESLKHLR